MQNETDFSPSPTDEPLAALVEPAPRRQERPTPPEQTPGWGSAVWSRPAEPAEPAASLPWADASTVAKPWGTTDGASLWRRATDATPAVGAEDPPLVKRETNDSEGAGGWTTGWSTPDELIDGDRPSLSLLPPITFLFPLNELPADESADLSPTGDSPTSPGRFDGPGSVDDDVDIATDATPAGSLSLVDERIGSEGVVASEGAASTPTVLRIIAAASLAIGIGLFGYTVFHGRNSSPAPPTTPVAPAVGAAGHVADPPITATVPAAASASPPPTAGATPGSSGDELSFSTGGSFSG